jgi:catechol 2,3-dioxygenase-like lactoylglutathione lyase family enzyme
MKLIAFTATTDVAAAKMFYRDTLGLRLVAKEATALVFDSNGTQLRIQRAKDTHPPSFTALGWEVPDIKGAVHALVERGVAFERFGFFQQDEDGIWTADDGTQVAWFKDPDGYLLSLTEFPYVEEA